MTGKSMWNHARSGMAGCLVSLIVSTASQADTLADALVGAYNTSGLLQQNRALLRAADEDVAISGAFLKPIVNWSADMQRRFGDVTVDTANGRSSNSVGETTVSAGINAAWQLYDGGADSTRVEANKEIVLATRNQLLSVEQSVLLRATSAYFNVLRRQEFVNVSNNNLRVLREELRASQDRFEVGEVTRTDVAQAEAAVAEALSRQAITRRDLIQAQAEYTSVVGKPPGVLSVLPSLPRTETNVARAQGVAVQNHPDLLRAQHEVAANDLLAVAAGLDTLPTVSLTGSLRQDETFNSDDSSSIGTVGIQVAGPIYRGGELSARERQAYAFRDAARGNLLTTRDDVQQFVVDAISTYAAAQASLKSSEEGVRAARVAFEGTREEARLGARTTLDVLDSEQRLLDAEIERISNIADQYIAAYAVLQSMGLLTAERLRLPVQIYDPEAYYDLVKDGPTKQSKQGQQLDRVLRALQNE